LTPVSAAWVYASQVAQIQDAAASGKYNAMVVYSVDR
jgi:hypothetical protein